MNKTLSDAIRKQIVIGGKLFCWHDWIFLSHALPSDVGEFIQGVNAEYLCTKCGKNKRCKFESEITRYDECGNKIS